MTIERDNLLAQHDHLKAEAKRISKALAAIEADAIKAGYAEKRADHHRETAPNKANFIDLFGQEAWDAAKTVTTIRKFFWL
ncbi:MAG: hypothetical protein GY854_23520 [Deltaproteobacteria bacterium]|nr:hypothetical protein [Deltaproteobacteria bacterium]